MSKPRLMVLVGMIAAAAFSRLIPHPYNFAPITAMALFGGAHFSDKRKAFLVPLLAMLLSDLILGWHATMPFVYLSFALIVLMGRQLVEHKSVVRIAGATLASSALFFLITNFGVWAVESLYPKTAVGLMTCYAAALPFFQMTLLGDALYTAALFGVFALANKWIPALQETSLVPVH